MNTGKTKIGILNILASSLAFLFTVYITVIYITLMVGSEPNTLAYEIASDYAANWIYRFVLVILMYVFCLANIITIPAYIFLKRNNNSIAGLFAKIQIASCTCMFVVALLFWTSFGVIFMGNTLSPYSTIYRILEIIFTPIMVGLCIFNMLYTPSDDMMKQLKKKANKI